MKPMPMAMPSCVSKPSSVPSVTLLAISGSAFSPSSLMPRTLAPTACAGVEAITWPSISGTACLTRGRRLAGAWRRPS